MFSDHFTHFTHFTQVVRVFRSVLSCGEGSTNKSGFQLDRGRLPDKQGRIEFLGQVRQTTEETQLQKLRRFFSGSLWESSAPR